MVGGRIVFGRFAFFPARASIRWRSQSQKKEKSLALALGQSIAVVKSLGLARASISSQREKSLALALEQSIELVGSLALTQPIALAIAHGLGNFVFLESWTEAPAEGAPGPL